MSDVPGEAVLATPERLEQAIEEAIEIGRSKPESGGPLNTFLGGDLMNMGRHLIENMRDEERWGEANATFEPLDFVIAAYEVARDYTAGKAVETNLHIPERLPLKITFNIFINFWLSHLAERAYGEEYAADVRAIIEENKLK